MQMHLSVENRTESDIFFTFKTKMPQEWLQKKQNFVFVTIVRAGNLW